MMPKVVLLVENTNGVIRRYYHSSFDDGKDAQECANELNQNLDSVLFVARGDDE